MRLTAALVMCTRNRPDDVDGALTTIAGQTRAAEMVAVVDSSNSTATREVVREHGTAWPSSRPPIHVPSAPSLTHQRRVGLACTVSDVVLFVDDDVRLGADYVAAVMQVFETEAGAGAAIGGVGGYMVNSEPRRVRALDRIFGLDSVEEGKMLASGRNIPVVSEPLGLLDVDWLSGAAMAYRRTLLECEPPDEASFPFEGEDADLSFRIGRHARLVVTPDAQYMHLESAMNRVSGATQAEAELAARLRRVVAQPDRLSMRAARLAAAYQLAKYTATGVATLSRRRLAVARGTAAALRRA
ncbi:MAG TPA: glycosyltransferase [Acidimicrobiia bacterium]